MIGGTCIPFFVQILNNFCPLLRPSLVALIAFSLLLFVMHVTDSKGVLLVIF